MSLSDPLQPDRKNTIFFVDDFPNLMGKTLTNKYLTRILLKKTILSKTNSTEMQNNSHLFHLKQDIFYLNNVNVFPQVNSHRD